MAAVAPTPPPQGLSSPAGSPLHRKPPPVSDLSPESCRWSQATESDAKPSPIVTESEMPKIRAAPASPVALSFHPDNWAQPSNAGVAGHHRYTSQSALLDTVSGQSLARSPMEVHESRERHQPSLDAIPQVDGGYDSSSHSELPPAQDPGRLSRDTDVTANSQHQVSAESSTATNASSPSQDALDSRKPSGEITPDESEVDDGVLSPPLVPQLQYHHQPVAPPADTEAKRSSSTNLTEQGMAINRHLTPTSAVRRSSMPRPQSTFSAYSDLSPGRSPGLSRKSPEGRPTSYAELLNVPYPQPAPAPLTIDNSHLRNNVGSNASLLSAQKTLEMYRQNVKKTNDHAIQYSFAVFLIATAQEQGLSHEEPSKGKVSKAAPAEGSPAGAGAQTSPAELVREAKSILTRLANNGYPFAQYYLADGYASGLFSKGREDYNSAFPLFVIAAKHGHAESAYRAGLCYEFGWGCRKDPAKAVQYLRTAASKSHPGAMTRLGKACLAGDFGEKRYREGIKWMKRATEASDAVYNAAPYQLGTLYETGYGDDIFKDESYAAELFTQAAELGHAEASFRMGDAYEHGKLNCPRDPALSVHFYTGAAERGHAAAMMGLCAWYLVGAEPILEKDEEEAYEWALRSAELGKSWTVHTLRIMLLTLYQALSRRNTPSATSPKRASDATVTFSRPTFGMSRQPIMAMSAPSSGWRPSEPLSMGAPVLVLVPVPVPGAHRWRWQLLVMQKCEKHHRRKARTRRTA